MSDEAEVVEKKNKKISKMSLAEIESAMKKTEESMNGQNAKYYHHLVARKSELANKK